MKMESEMKMKISVLAIGKLRRMLYYRVFHDIKRYRQKIAVFVLMLFCEKANSRFYCSDIFCYIEFVYFASNKNLL